MLGVVQGLTEFLPVSSTAHLLIAGALAGVNDAAFTVMIQLGSILAVMWLYRVKILSVIAGLPSDPAARHFALMLAVACIPGFLAGAFLADFIQSVLYESVAVIGWALVLGGLLMLVAERIAPAPVVREVDDTPVWRALVIGACQMVALIPGVSRSGATIVGARLAGLDRSTAAEFSFFLAMPTMIGAFVYELASVGNAMTPGQGLTIAIGFVMAFVAAALVVKPFLRYLTRVGFGPFAWYRIVVGAALLAAAAQGWTFDAVAAP